VRARVPDAACLIDHLRDMGAMAAGVTGSGSACFGLFDAFDAAAEAIQQTPCGVRWKAIARPLAGGGHH
jgi:4-diphosphocytidyl-2C-methyl-D-erythritol kinase